MLSGAARFLPVHLAWPTGKHWSMQRRPSFKQAKVDCLSSGDYHGTEDLDRLTHTDSLTDNAPDTQGQNSSVFVGLNTHFRTALCAQQKRDCSVKLSCSTLDFEAIGPSGWRTYVRLAIRTVTE